MSTTEAKRTDGAETEELDVIIVSAGFAGLYLLDRLRGMATAGFPNLLFVYGPQSPNAFANGPTCAELQGDWIVEMLGHLRQRSFTRLEATLPAEEASRPEVRDIADSTLFPRAESWYLGANIRGKPREMLSFAGGLSTYMAKCNESAERGYEGFAIS